MPELTSFVGIVMQLGAALLLLGLFYLLQRENRRRTYFTVWGWAWGGLALAVAALGLRDLLATATADDGTVVSGQHALLFFYQWAKLLFGGLLLLGALLFAGELRVPVRLAVAGLAVVSATGAAAGWAVTSNLAGALAWVSPMMVVVFAFCSWKLLRVPRSRRGIGSRAVGVLFGAMAVVPALYLVSVSGRTSLSATSPLRLLIVYFFLEVLLGCAMVVMRLEEERREADDARTRLQVSHDHLMRASYDDALTGVLNRRAFAEGVGVEAARAVYGAVALLDLDNLKQVNDTYGHAAGDTMLRELADALRACLRASDALYRWGGDEFLLVLPNAAVPEARRRVEEALLIAGAGLASAPSELQPSVSVGTAIYSGAEDLPSAIESADRDMYREKRRRKAGSGSAADLRIESSAQHPSI
jgi:diguanylate cyclase (GGDEF)-like protein